MNVFGERQKPEKYIPMVIKKVRDNQTISVHANSEKTKEDQGIIFMQVTLQMH